MCPSDPAWFSLQKSSRITCIARICLVFVQYIMICAWLSSAPLLMVSGCCRMFCIFISVRARWGTLLYLLRVLPIICNKCCLFEAASRRNKWWTQTGLHINNHVKLHNTSKTWHAHSTKFIPISCLFKQLVTDYNEVGVPEHTSNT